MEQIHKGKWSRFAARITNPPGLKWVFRSIVIAGIAALALDYFNTPIRAWLQYHVPFPASGGQSAATVAAKESAGPQAKIEQEINIPAQSAERQRLVDEGSQELLDRTTKLAKFSLRLNGDEKYWRLDNDYYHDAAKMLASGDTYMPLWNMLDDNGDYQNMKDNLSAPPQNLTAGTAITPMVFTKGSGHNLATIVKPDGSQLVLFRIEAGGASTQYGAMLKPDFDRLQPAH